MNTRLARLRGSQGFTLIELLIVVVIIGILAAIAIPQFASTKQKAFEATAKSDLRNLMTAEESYYADTQTYKPLSGVTSASTDLPGWRLSESIGSATAGGTATVTVPSSNGGDGYQASVTLGTSQGGSCYGVDTGTGAGNTDPGQVKLNGGSC